jgi:pyrroloquinoline quinone (PQQ) biosynthesis protein C
MMRDATLPLSQIQKFLTGVWLTIERFPQFMALNLQKLQFGDSVGADMARKFLIHSGHEGLGACFLHYLIPESNIYRIT